MFQTGSTLISKQEYVVFSSMFFRLRIASNCSRSLQMLTIHLGQDENDCFSAWVSAKETGLAENDAVDQKGKHLLH